jgi:hypothetical protein
LRRVDKLFLEFNKFVVVSSLEDLKEGRELAHEDLTLSEIKGVFISNLCSEEIDQLEGNLVVLKSLNVVVISCATFLKERSD